MKKAFIIISALLALLLCLAGCNFNFSVGVNYTYDSAGYEKNEENTEKTFDGTVQKVDMDWVSGKIVFVKGDKFSIREKATKGEYFPLYYKLEAGTLYIKWAENGTSSTAFKNREKEITVTVTEEFGAILLNNVSASFDIDVYSADVMDINNVSGNGEIKAGTVKSFKYDGVSGDMKLTAEVSGKVDINTVSGKVTLNQNAAANNSYKLNTVSGDIEIKLPADASGYSLKVSTISGGYSSAFGEKEYGDGSVGIDFNSVSASLKITKAE